MTQNLLRAGTVKNDIENYCNHRNEIDKHLITIKAAPVVLKKQIQLKRMP